MDNIKINATDRHPAIDFDYASNRFSISGYSYPENARDFYDPIVDPFISYLENLNSASLSFHCAFTYFHSSSAQVLYRIFDAMEECAATGNTISVTWVYEAGDDSMQEAGEDFAEDLENVAIELVESEAG